MKVFVQTRMGAETLKTQGPIGSVATEDEAVALAAKHLGVAAEPSRFTVEKRRGHFWAIYRQA